MVEWMRGQAIYLQPLRECNVLDELTAGCCLSRSTWPRLSKWTHNYYGVFEVYAPSRDLPASMLVIHEIAGHHTRLASQSDADPFIVLRFAAKHYAWGVPTVGAKALNCLNLKPKTVTRYPQLPESTSWTEVLPETNSARNIIFPAPKWEWRPVLSSHPEHLREASSRAWTNAYL